MLGTRCPDRHALLRFTSSKLRRPRRLLPSRASGFVLRMQPALLPHKSLEDYVDEENTVRVIGILLTIDTQLSVEVLSSWNHEEFQDQIDASQPRAAPEGPLG
jgi:hypothetical protein